MHSRHGCCLLALSALLGLNPLTPAGAAIYRCDDAQGQPHFSDQPCAPGLQGTTIVLQPLNSITAPLPQARSTTERPHERSSRRHRETPAEGRPALQGRIITTGLRTDSCGNSDDEPRLRRAMVEGRILTGMPVSAVEKALGKPDRTSQASGRLRYHYEGGHGHRAQTVQFDENGCVTGKGKRRSSD